MSVLELLKDEAVAIFVESGKNLPAFLDFRGLYGPYPDMVFTPGNFSLVMAYVLWITYSSKVVGKMLRRQEIRIIGRCATMFWSLGFGILLLGRWFRYAGKIIAQSEDSCGKWMIGLSNANLVAAGIAAVVIDEHHKVPMIVAGLSIVVLGMRALRAPTQENLGICASFVLSPGPAIMIFPGILVIANVRHIMRLIVEKEDELIHLKANPPTKHEEHVAKHTEIMEELRQLEAWWR